MRDRTPYPSLPPRLPPPTCPSVERNKLADQQGFTRMPSNGRWPYRGSDRRTPDTLTYFLPPGQSRRGRTQMDRGLHRDVHSNKRETFVRGHKSS
ncbi:hypothetical protein EYF80_059544 [Liparis tanakae]|uniref:Uncharacterized protein n=1 Tax=Liparis tanakae TaxID=230148 RepID=A0A4Z2EPH1_9TELE|nr:hypothetical protein EYF80_059544 [Liparis tanakae]